MQAENVTQVKSIWFDPSTTQWLLSVLIVCIAVTACELPFSEDPFSAEISDTTGKHRLALVYIPVGAGTQPNIQHFDFHSLVWRSKSATGWSDRVVITKADFNEGSPRERWVTEVHSFDPNNAEAVVKVAEVSEPRTDEVSGSSFITCTYSWRVWDLISNREVRFLRECKNPFEPFE